MKRAEGLINKILKDMPKGLNNLEKARYVYITLGKKKSYDEEFWFANSKTRQKIFKSRHSTKIDFAKLIENNKVVCTSISKIYSVILKQIGIENYIERPDLSDEHIYVILTIEGKNFSADLQRDLGNIHSNKKTEHFGTKIDGNYDEINENELEKIDRKIGYLSVNQNYLDKDIFYLKSIVKKQKDLYSKVDVILKNASRYANFKSMGYIETVQYYKWILAECLDEKELKNIINSNCYREKGEDKQYISCLSINGRDGYKRYIYSLRESKYIQVNDKKIIQLMNEGLKLVSNSKLPGLKRMNIGER